MSLSIYHAHSLSLGHMSEREVAGIREILLLSGDHILCFRVLILVLILSLRNLWGSLFYGFLEENIFVYCLLCLIDVLVILSVKDTKIMLA